MWKNIVFRQTFKCQRAASLGRLNSKKKWSVFIFIQTSIIFCYELLQTFVWNRLLLSTTLLLFPFPVESQLSNVSLMASIFDSSYVAVFQSWTSTITSMIHQLIYDIMNGEVCRKNKISKLKDCIMIDTWIDIYVNFTRSICFKWISHWRHAVAYPPG